MSDMKVTKYKTLTGAFIRSDNPIREGSRMHGSGTVVKEHSRTAPARSMCGGCRDDFYNGHNQLGVSECWSFKSAKVVDKIGYSSLHVANGPDTIKKNTLSCWHAVSK